MDQRVQSLMFMYVTGNVKVLMLSLRSYVFF